MYLFTALLLVARIQAVRRQSQWDRRGISYDEGLRALTLSDSFFLALAVIAVAFLLPAAGGWSTATKAYESLRTPLIGLEDDSTACSPGFRPAATSASACGTT